IAQAKISVIMTAGAFIAWAIASPAAADSVRWRTVIGIMQAGNVVAGITGGGQPWSTLGGHASDLSTSRVELEGRGLDASPSAPPIRQRTLAQPRRRKIKSVHHASRRNGRRLVPHHEFLVVAVMADCVAVVDDVAVLDEIRGHVEQEADHLERLSVKTAQLNLHEIEGGEAPGETVERRHSVVARAFITTDLDRDQHAHWNILPSPVDLGAEFVGRPRRVGRLPQHADRGHGLGHGSSKAAKDLPAA